MLSSFVLLLLYNLEYCQDFVQSCFRFFLLFGCDSKGESGVEEKIDLLGATNLIRGLCRKQYCRE